MVLSSPNSFSIPLIAVEVSYYRLFLLLALCTTTVVALWLIKKSDLNFKRSSATLIVAALVFFVGARLFNILIRPELYFAQPWRLYSLDVTGFPLYGGLLAATIVVFLSLRGNASEPKQSIDCSSLGGQARFTSDFARHNNTFWKFADIAAPAFGLGLTIMRIGCFLNGCCFGKPTTLPWGVSYLLFSDAHIWQMANNLTGPFAVLPVHPTQFYEAVYALTGAIIAFWLIKKKSKPGIATLTFIVWLTSFRLANHFLRALPYDAAVTSYIYPTFYLAIIVGCGYLLINRSRSAKS